MSIVDLKSIHFYQPRTKSSLSRKRLFKASTARSLTVPERGNPLKVFEPSDEWNTSWDDSPIKFPNIVDSPFRKDLGPLREEAPNLKRTEADLRCKVFSSSLTQSLTILDIPNILCDISIPNHDITKDDYSPSLLEKLFCDGGEIAMYKEAGSNGDVEEKRLQNKIQSDDGQAADLEFEHSKDTGRYMSFMYQRRQHERPIDALLILDDDCSQEGNTDPAGREAGNVSIIQFIGGLILEEQKSGSQKSPSTPSMFVARSEAR